MYNKPWFIVMRTLVNLSVLVGGLLLIGCTRTSPGPKRHDNVVRVMMLSGRSYYVVTINPATKELTTNYFSTAKVFSDVPSDQSMWAEESDQGNTIHIHSGTDLQGSGGSGKGSSDVMPLK